jgi:hypothetical protein
MDEPWTLAGGILLNSGVLLWGSEGQLWYAGYDSSSIAKVDTNLGRMGFSVIPSGNARSLIGVSLRDGMMYAFNSRKVTLEPTGGFCSAAVGRNAVPHSGDSRLALTSSRGGFHAVQILRIQQRSCEVLRTGFIECGHTISVASSSTSHAAAVSCDHPNEDIVWVHADPSAQSLSSQSRFGPVRGGSSGSWSGLPLLVTDRGFVRQSANIESDDRRMDFWMLDGTYWRSVNFEDPIGFFASDPHDKQLLGMRTWQGRAIILVYRWHWNESQ